MQIKGKFLLSITLLITIFTFNIFAGWSQTSKVTADPRVKNEYFGREVDIYRDWAIAGHESYDSINGTDTLKNIGRAYIYHRDTVANIWSLYQELPNLSYQGNSYFGNAVAISGNFAFVGAYCEDIDPGGSSEKLNVGAVYIYELVDTFSTGAQWVYRQKIQESDIEVNEYFGKEISADDDVMAVGVPQADNQCGAIYVYKKNSYNQWIKKERIDGSISAPPHFVINNGTQLGYAIDINGLSLVSGMPGYKNSSGDSTYAALGVWFKDDTSYTDYTYGLITPNGFSGMEDPIGFGHSVAVYDNDDDYTNGTPYSFVAIGAYNDKKGSNSYGAVYLYTYQQQSGSTAYYKHALLRNTESGTNGGRFGWDIDIDGNTVAISSFSDNYKADNGFITSYGGAFIYSFWGKNLQYAIHADDAAQSDQFGRSIAVNYRGLFVGASAHDFDANGADSINGAGAAYFFYNNRDLFPEVIDTIPDLEVSEDNMPVKYVALDSVFVDYSSTASNTTEDLVYTISLDTSLLTAEVIDGDTLQLSFPENANGYVNVTVTATDTAGQKAIETFGVRIVPQNDAPEFNTPVTAAKEEDPYSFTKIASDIDGDIVDIEVFGTLPSWLTLNKERVVLTDTLKFEESGGIVSYSNPSDMVSDQQGNIFVTYGNYIAKIQPNGNVIRFWAGYNSGFVDSIGKNAAFNSPKGLAIDNAGNLYVADAHNHAIRKIDTNRVVTTIAGGTSGNVDANGTDARFNYPYDVVVDSVGNIYVSDYQNGSIRKIDINGDVTSITASGAINNPGKLIFNSSGEIIVSAQYMVVKVDVTTGGIDTIAGAAASGAINSVDPLSARFYNIEGLVFDSEGNLFIADNVNNAIRKLDDSGVTTYAGILSSGGYIDGSIDSAKIDGPTSIVSDNSGNIYFYGNNSKLRVVTHDYSLTGTPAITDVGDHEVSFIAKDPYGLTDTITFTIHVDNINDAPVMTSVQADTIDEDAEIEILLSMTDASDVDGDSLSVILLDGANYTVSGNVVKPDTNYNGELSVGVTFTDGEFNTDTLNMVITVAPVNDKPLVTSADTASAKEDVMFAYTATATDVETTPTITFGYIPSWMSVNGVIVLGTPLAGGDTSFSIIASDGELADTQIVNISIADSNDAPVVSNAMMDITVEQGTAVSELLPIDQFSDIDGDALTISATGFPAGVELISGAIEGTFDNVDTLIIVITATDPSGLSVDDTVLVYVDPMTSIYEVDDEFKKTTEITVYPNPVEQSSDNVSILIPGKYAGTGSIVIFDILGHELDKQQITVRDDVTFRWDLRNSDGQKVASGTYPALVMIKTDSGELISKKIYIGIKE